MTIKIHRALSTIAFTLMGLFWSGWKMQHVSAGIHIPNGDKEGGNQHHQQPPLSVYDDFFFSQVSQQGDTGIYRILVSTILPFMLEHVQRKQHGNVLQQEDPRTQISTIDVGCASGDLVEQFRSEGIAQAYGMEGASAATNRWPSSYRDDFYLYHDLNTEAAWREMPPTDFVTTFEVAEHLPASSAVHMVKLLTKHEPRAVFFGAATVFQDRGLNPTHVNERPLQYWVDLFQQQSNYTLDAATSFLIRYKLTTSAGELGQKYWWYPKNMLVFRPTDPSNHDNSNGSDNWQQERLRKLGPMDKVYEAIAKIANAAGHQSDFGQMWYRDWQEFGRIFRATVESCAA